MQRNPGAVGHVLADDVGADERHEEHQNAGERDEHPGDVGALRNSGAAGGIAAVSAVSAVAGEISAAGAFVGVNQLMISSVTIVLGTAFTPNCILRPAKLGGSGPRTSAVILRELTCDGSTHCGMKSSTAPGTLNSYGPR